MSDFLNLVQSLKSVRSFDGAPLRPEDRARLERYLEDIPNPFGVPVRFVLLDAQAQGLSSPVLSGETLYVAGMVRQQPRMEVGYGFSFEKLVLFAWSLGVGSTWIGGTMKRELFERAAGLAAGERMPCVSPLGYPAEKRSVRESLMRRGVGADSRLPADRLFFDGAWDVPLSAAGRDGLAELMEAVRWAPSAVNRQPWRIVAEGGRFHFYEKPDKGYLRERIGDLQKIDLGIALCHFVMGLEAQGKAPKVLLSDPGLPVPAGVEYIATVETGER